MNKIISKIVGVALGLSLAVGTGIAIAANTNPVRTNAATETVNFTASTNGGWNATAGAQSGTVDGITVACSNGVINGGTQLRFYAKSTITISSSVGNVSKVEFTATQGTLTAASTGSYTDLTWTGDSSSFTLTVGTQIRATKVAVSYSSGGTATTLDAITAATATITAAPGDENWTISDASATGTLSGVANQIVTDYVDFSVTTAVPETVGTITVSLVATPKDGVSGNAEAFTNSSATGTVSLANYNYTFTATKFTAATTETLSDERYSPSWTLATDGGYFGYDGTKGQQIGSRNDPTSTATLSTSSFSYGISSVTIETCGYASGTVSVSVGGNSFGGNAKTYSATNTEYVFEKEGSSQFTGTLVISWSNTGGRAVYVKRIAVSFETVQAVHVTSIDLGNDISIAKGLSETIVPTVTPSNATNQNITYVSGDTSIATVDNTGKVTGVAVGTTTITGTSVDNSSATDSITVAVTAAIPSSLSWSSQQKTMVEGYTLGSYFTNEKNILTVKYSDASTAVKHLGDSGLTITLAGETVTSSYVLSASDNGKQLRATYVEGNVTVFQSITIEVSALLAFNSVTENFAGGKAYLLVNDDSSTLSVSYTSLEGQPTVSAVSSNEDVLLAEADTLTYNTETKQGTFNVTLVAGAIGSAYITLEMSCGQNTLTKTTNTIVVRSSDPVSSEDKYVKVTSYSSITVDGRYLIVNEGHSVVMNPTLDSGNTIDVTFTANDEITTGVAALEQYEVELNLTAGTIKNANDKYLYGSAGSNALSFSDDPQAHSELTIDSGDFSAISNTSVLRYNSSSSVFRYYKSASYSSQAAVQLYMFVEGDAPTDDESVVLGFINDYMHPEINANDGGTGLCRTNGWYTAAKTHISSNLNNTQRLLFKNSFNNYYLRLQAWARANSETFEIGTDGTIASSRVINPLTFDSNSTGAAIAVITIALVSITFIGGYFFLRKKKEN